MFISIVPAPIKMLTFPWATNKEIYPIYSLISLLSIKKNIVSCVERKRKNGNESAFLQRRNYLKTIENLRWTICFHRHLHLQRTIFFYTLHVITGRKKKRKNRTPPFLLQNPQIIPRILINVHAHVASNETLYEFIRQEFPYRGGESLVEAHASSNETTTSE